MKLIENNVGVNEIIVIDNCEYDVFYSFAGLLEEKIGIVYLQKVDDFDSLYWSFRFEDNLMVLYYNVFLGIIIYPQNGVNASPIEKLSLLNLFDVLKQHDINI